MLLALCLGLVLIAHAGENPTTTLSRPIGGNGLTLPAGARVLGPLPTQRLLHLIVGLSPRHQDVLQAFLALRSRSDGPLAHQSLTAGQFADLFSPTAADQQTVVAYLRRHGLRVTRTYPDRLLLDVEGTVEQAEAAFGVRLVRYRDRQGVEHFANATVPSLPAPLANLVGSIVGLRDDAPFRHAPGPGLAPHGPRPRSLLGAMHDLPAPAADQLTPAQLQSAYDFTPIYSQVFSATSGMSVTAAITGSGQTVAIFELSNFNPGDIAAYDNYFGLSAPTPISIPVDGGPTNLFGWNGTDEAALDIEMVQAVAPGAQVLVYAGPGSPSGNNNQGADDAYAQMVNDGRAQVLSTSWGQCEPDQLLDQPPDIDLLHNLFAEAVARGMTVVASSSDYGANDCTDNQTNPSVDYPASDPYVIGVGGTILNPSPTPETSWSLSGGGTSIYFDRPSWQTGPGVPTPDLPGATRRLVPDVAMNAGRDYAVWAGGQWIRIRGTSAGPPIWAGLLALINQSRYVAAQVQGAPTPLPCAVVPGLGDLHAPIYQLAATPPATPAFRDITSGEGNGIATPGHGWDAVTGWGVPDAYALLRALIALPALAAPTPGPCPTATPSVAPTATRTPLPTSQAGHPTATATQAIIQTVTPTRTLAGRTPTPRSTTSATAAAPPPSATARASGSALVFSSVPSKVLAGGMVTLQVRGARGPRRAVIFEYQFPGQRLQRVHSTTDKHGSASLRVRVPKQLPQVRQGHIVIARLHAIVQEGKTRRELWLNLSILPPARSRGAGARPPPGYPHLRL